MNLLEIIVLAVIQGITEFLPVSSSGHLVVTNALLESLGARPPADLAEVNVVLHFGTLLSVLVYYRRRVFRLLGEDRRVIALLAVGTVPLVAFGLGVKYLAPRALEDPLLAGLMFPLTGALLIWSSRFPPGQGSYQELTWRETILIGLLQAVAALPGISRSGATIGGGLLVGLRREQAATFAFLLAIPAILGACVLESLKLIGTSVGASAENISPTSPTVLALGALVSFLVGLGSLALLVRLVERGRLAWFAYWLIPLGFAVIAWKIGG